MRFARSGSVLLLMLSLAFAQRQKSSAGGADEARLSALTSTSEDVPAPSKPLTSLDLSSMDNSVDPCADFYQYACGNWIKSNPIPADQSRWGRFNQLAENNRIILHNILEKAAAQKTGRTPVERLIGDYYGACMDEKSIEAKNATPLKPGFDRINAIKNNADLFAEIGSLRRAGAGALMSFFSNGDFRDASQFVASVDQGGLTLPDRDYYIKDDPKSKETREKYLVHLRNMFSLAGDAADQASVEAQTVMKIETALANAAMDRTLRRDPKTRDHKLSYAQLKALAPNFDFDKYFVATGAPKFDSLNVGNPDFFKQISTQIDSWPLDDMKSYLRWHYLNANANALSTAFVNEAFAFRGKYLQGQKELQTRWKRCVRATDADLGEALGQLYVQLTFGADGKARTLDLVQRLERAMGEDIRSLGWMSDATQQRALEKLNAIVNNIGYPDKWRDYSKMKITPGDYFGNNIQANQFEFNRQITKIGTKVDRKEWGMSPPTVNAYAQPQRTTINFPAGILQPPFFDKTIDDAVNFGAIGVVVGHEMTHLFDDQGRKFDKDGNLNDWWTPEDGKKFEEKVSCIADEYSGFTAIEEVKLNGRLTLGENTADNGGLKLSYMAMEEKLKDGDRKKIDGFTPEQRFFLGFAQVWCENSTDESKRLLAKTDPHSPGRYRTNGVVSNSAEFQRTFGCKAGQPMVRENACHVW